MINDGGTNHHGGCATSELRDPMTVAAVNEVACYDIRRSNADATVLYQNRVHLSPYFRRFTFPSDEIILAYYSSVKQQQKYIMDSYPEPI